MNELNNALSGMDPAEVALGAGFAAVIATLLVVGAVVWFFVSAVGYFKMFKKANLRGWFAFIPILREFNMFKMSWTIKTFVISTVLLIVFQVLGDAQNIILNLVALVCAVVWLVIQIKLLVRIAKSFGKGGGCAALLFFFPFVTSLVLGFGKAQYVGNPEEKKEEAASSEA